MPKETKFFEMLAELADNGVLASENLSSIFSKWDNIGEHSKQIHLLEHKCDELTHKVVSELNETFITPIDREDIHSFVNSLDNVIDSMDKIANRIHIYKVKKNIDYGSQLAEILNIQLKNLSEIINKFEDDKNIHKKLTTIRNYETQGDTIFQEALSHLFENEQDAIELIKKKEILELLEKAIDRCQTVAIVIEGILIKNA